MRYASLFTGIGGLDRAVDAIGGECVVQVEREPYCLDVLRLRWPDVPKVLDVRDYHPEPGTLDLVIGGPPCQPVSHAGRRKGAEDDRWLWGEALRVVAEAQPGMAFFENPIGLRTLGLDGILDEFTSLGYGGAWEVVAAADVGAPHLRKRLWIMAVRGAAPRGWTGPTRPKGNRRVLWPTPTATQRPNEGNVRLLRARVKAGDMTADEAAGMLNGKDVYSAQGTVPAHIPTPTRSDGAGGAGTTPKREGGLNLRTFVDHWPTPTSRDHKDTGDSVLNGTVPVNGLLGRAVGPSIARGALSPDWVEWLMGLPTGWTDVSVAVPGPLHGWESEPSIPRVGLGIPNRSKRLTALGNAVVPAQASFALERLVERLLPSADGAAA